MKRKYRLRVLLPSAIVLTGFIVLLCLCLGSVPIALNETIGVLRGALTGAARDDYIAVILLRRRLPRVLCAGLIGASLSLSAVSALPCPPRANLPPPHRQKAAKVVY